MKEVVIKSEHFAQLQGFEHVGEWLQAERQRLAAELAYVQSRETTLARDIQAFLLQSYGITPDQSVMLDTGKGVILVTESEKPKKP